jgi:uncharacterized membrane protein
VAVFLLATAVSYVMPTIVILWAVALLYLFNESAEIIPIIGDVKTKLVNQIDGLLTKAKLKSQSAVAA